MAASRNEQAHPNRSVTPSPPIQLSKHAWGQDSVLTIRRSRFVEGTEGQDGTKSRSKWTGIIGKLNERFKYTRIPKDKIRILLIKPGALDEQINVSLIDVHDDEMGTDKFPHAALSYNWGESDDTHNIIIQDDPKSHPFKKMETFADVTNAATMQWKILRVKPNLYQALKHLRHEREVVSIWVDAICIDQCDNVEKKDQVLKMAQIYRKAYNVNVWLGPENASSSRAMSFIKKVIDPDSHVELLKDVKYTEDWVSLFELLKWRW